MSSEISNRFCTSLNISSIFLWDILLADAALNDSCLYLYLPNWPVNVVRHDDCSSSLSLWYWECASIINKYLMLNSFGNIPLRVGPLLTGCMDAWLTLVGSKNNLAFPLSFGTSLKLLHPYTVLSMPHGMMMSSCCRHSSSSLNSFCNAWTLGRPGIVCCNENIPLNHLLPVNTALNSPCNTYTISALAFLSGFLSEAWNEIVYLAINVINDHWLISIIWIWNTSSVCTAFIGLACFLCVICVLAPTFCLTESVFILCLCVYCVAVYS